MTTVPALTFIKREALKGILTVSTSKPKKTETISVRLMKSERDKLTKIATAEERTVSQVLRRLLRLVEEKPSGFQPPTDYRLAR